VQRRICSENQNFASSAQPLNSSPLPTTMDKLDMSLSDISKKEKKPSSGPKKGGRGGRGGGRRTRGGYGRGGPVRNTRRRQGYNSQPYAPRPQGPPPAKKKLGVKKNKRVLVSNLSEELSEADIWEVFEQMEYGRDKIKNMEVNYKSDGTFNGSVVAVFFSAAEAERCVEEYDGAEVDKRELFLDFIVSLETLRNYNTTSNRGAPKESKYNNGYDNSGYYDQQYYPSQRPARGGGGRGRRRGGRGRGGRGGRGGGRKGRGGGGGKKEPKKPATKEDLDAELDDYYKNRPSDEPAAAGDAAE